MIHQYYIQTSEMFERYIRVFLATWKSPEQNETYGSENPLHTIFFRRDVNSRKYYMYVFQICLFRNVCVHVCTFKDKYEVSKIKIFVKYYPNYNEVFVGVIFFHTRCNFVRWQNSTVYVSLRLIRGLFGFLRCLTHWGRVKHICVDK